MLIALLAVQERRFPDPLLPPRLFANAVFVRGVGIAFCGALALFGGSFLLPLFFQLVMGVDAASPARWWCRFLLRTVSAPSFAGSAGAPARQDEAIMIAGLVGCLVGFVLLALIDRTTPRFCWWATELVLGFGIGMVMPSSLVCVQNAADRRDIGAATGCLLFLRSMGGAFGSTLVGALLARSLPRGWPDSASPRTSTSVRYGSTAARIAGVTADMLPHVQVALAGAFHIAFLACAIAMVAALVVALGMRDLPLRAGVESDTPDGVAVQPASLAH